MVFDDERCQIINTSNIPIWPGLQQADDEAEICETSAMIGYVVGDWEFD